ncbi:MAG: anion transporter [Alphaproteobacteria bacterium]|nr:anion transporter [Alphaproteobacteria bacterium]
MTTLILLVFLATYLGMAAGRVPGLKLDRTGIALFAGVLLLAVGAVPVDSLGSRIDLPTLMLLFGLMIVSAQFQGAGFYRYAAARIAGAHGHPVVLLALTVAVAGGLSAILVNDIVVFAMAPILALGATQRGLDPRPFLIALAGAANAGSAITVIGNPQNILIGQVGGLDFWRFLAVCAVPGLLALICVFTVTWAGWRGSLAHQARTALPPPEPAQRWPTIKGALSLLLLIAAFATPFPRELAALAVAGLLLASRKMSSREMIGAVDWHLLLLIASLFLVTSAFAQLDIAASGVALLKEHGWRLESLSVMTPVMLFLSNSIGNVPAVILLLSLFGVPDAGTLHGMALLSTLSGNLLLTGSLANIIVAERAQSVGVKLGFADHAKSGVPMTLLSLALAVGWLWAIGEMGF